MPPIARWVSLGSIGLNLLLFAAAVGLMARRGGWAYVQTRLLHRQTTGDATIYEAAYYRHRQSQFDQLPVAAADILFIGDSITDEGEWSDWFPAATLRNRGISGDTTAGVLRRLPALLDTAPETIFLMIGINDLIFLGRSPEQVLGRYGQILTLMQQRAPQTQVYVQSVLPVGDPYSPELNAKILQLNRGLATLAAAAGYTYVDLHPLFVVEGQLDSACTADGLHLNGEGYARWVEHIRPLID